MKHKRAPKGYRIEQWLDGFYHVYYGGSCLDEVLSKSQAIEIAWNDKTERESLIQNPISPTATLCIAQVAFRRN